MALGRRLSHTHPETTAVFATADILAIGIMEGLAETGTLTTVAQDLAAKATNAVDLLVEAVRHQRRPTVPVTLEVNLVERRSTAPAPEPTP